MTPVVSHDTCPQPLSVAASGPQSWSSKMLQVEAVSSLATTSEAPEYHQPAQTQGQGSEIRPPMKERHSPLKAEHVGRETLNCPLLQGRWENSFVHSAALTACALGRSVRRCPSTWPLCQGGAPGAQGSEGLERCCWPGGRPLRRSARAGFVARASAPAAQAQLLKEPF